MKHETLKQVLMRRDGVTSEEADKLIHWARHEICEGADPEELLLSEFGLELDFILDLI